VAWRHKRFLSLGSHLCSASSFLNSCLGSCCSCSVPAKCSQLTKAVGFGGSWEIGWEIVAEIACIEWNAVFIPPYLSERLPAVSLLSSSSSTYIGPKWTVDISQLQMIKRLINKFSNVFWHMQQWTGVGGKSLLPARWSLRGAGITLVSCNSRVQARLSRCWDHSARCAACRLSHNGAEFELHSWPDT